MNYDGESGGLPLSNAVSLSPLIYLNLSNQFRSFNSPTSPPLGALRFISFSASWSHKSNDLRLADFTGFYLFLVFWFLRSGNVSVDLMIRPRIRAFWSVIVVLSFPFSSRLDDFFFPLRRWGRRKLCCRRKRLTSLRWSTSMKKLKV